MGTQSTTRCDVLVIGGRCAGAATAMLLARRGLRVTVAERRARGADTISTHALMRGAVLQLDRWGLLPRIVAAGTPAVRTTVFRYGADRVEIALKPGPGGDALYAPRRTVLDPILADAAVTAGADVRYRTTCASLVRDRRGRVCGAILRDADGNTDTVTAGLVVGADGVGSTVAREVGAAVTHQARSASAVLFTYVEGLSSPGYDWGYGDGIATGVIPTNGGRTCVFAAVPATLSGAPAGRPADRLRALVERGDPVLASSLSHARMVESVRGFGGVPGVLRQPFGPGWALVGDAGYFKDPITAHGITDALRDAELLAAAIAAGTLTAFRDYAAVRDALSRPLLEVTDRIASFDWTTGTLPALHAALNAAMKAEVQEMEARFAATPPGEAATPHQPSPGERTLASAA
jgi:flavin-dependent dehydrogenase